LRGDINCDGVINGVEFGAILGCFGLSTQFCLQNFDFDNNGIIDGSDFGFLLGLWGQYNSSSSSGQSSSSSAPYMMGDYNNNNIIDEDDIYMFFMCFGSNSPDCLKYFDFNSNGTIDNQDARALLALYQSFNPSSSSSSSRPIGSSSSTTSASSSTSGSSSSAGVNKFPISANFNQESESRETDINKEFGISYYSTGYGGAIGDSFNADFSKIDALSIAKAEAYTGIVTFYNGSRIGKYDNVSLDVRNEAIKLAGSVPHNVLEDSFEGVNAGLTSGLSQIQHINIMSQNSSMVGIVSTDLNISSIYKSVISSQKAAIEYKKSFVTNFDVNTIQEVDELNSDVGSQKITSSVIADNKLGGLQSVTPINEMLLLVVGTNGLGVIDRDLDFDFVDIKMNLGEYILSASVTSDMIIVITSSRIMMLDLSFTVKSSAGYTGGIGSVLCGYSDGSDFVVSTNKGIYYASVGSSIFTQIYKPSYTGENAVDGVFKFIDTSSSYIAIGKNMYWTINNKSFSKISNEDNNFTINSIDKFFNKFVIATDKGIYVSATNMIGSGALRASVASASLVSGEPAAFVDVDVMQDAVGANIIQATVYALRSDGVVFDSDDPMSYFNKTNTPINKPIMISVFTDDVLIFSNSHVYSMNKSIMKPLTRALQ
jgi:hypothetical protein